LQAAFHEQHHRLYGFRREDVPVELLRIQISALGRIARVDDRGTGPVSRTTPTAASTRRLYLGDDWCEAPVFRRGDLAVGATLTGPCVVEEATSTTYLPPQFDLEVDARRNLHITAP